MCPKASPPGMCGARGGGLYSLHIAGRLYRRCHRRDAALHPGRDGAVGALSLPVRIDEALWNKQPGAALTAEAVTVALTAGERTETRVLAQALAAERENQYSASAWTDDALTEKKPLDEPVLLGARGVGLARTGDPQTAPPQYWRTLTRGRRRPIAWTGTGQKVYAQYAAGAVGVPAGATISYDEASHTVTAVGKTQCLPGASPR